MADPTSVILPSRADKRWRALVIEGPKTPIRVLALKFMLVRMAQEAKRDPSSASIEKNIDELYSFFVRHARLVATDTSACFGAA